MVGVLWPEYGEFFFFLVKSNTRRGAPEWCSPYVRFLHFRREGKVDQVRGWRRRCLCTRILKVWRLYVLGKMEAGREFQFLEVIGKNVLANEVIRHFSKKFIRYNPPKRRRGRNFKRWVGFERLRISELLECHLSKRTF